MRKFKQLLGVAVVSTITLGAPASWSQAFPLGEALPQMLLRVCPTLATAMEEANIAQRKGRQAMGPPGEVLMRNPSCYLDYLIVTPLRTEPAINPYMAWGIRFDPSSTETVKAPALGSDHRVPVSGEKATMRIYYAAFTSSADDNLLGWVEIPDHPYMIEYLKVR
jgi:hypothetical protein